MFPASSVQACSLLLTQLQASINSLKTSGVEIQPQTEESVENLQGLIRHLKERSREGTLRSDRDTYALLRAGGDNPGNGLFFNFRYFYFLKYINTLPSSHPGQKIVHFSVLQM